MVVCIPGGRYTPADIVEDEAEEDSISRASSIICSSSASYSSWNCVGSSTVDRSDGDSESGDLASTEAV